MIGKFIGGFRRGPRRLLVARPDRLEHHDVLGLHGEETRGGERILHLAYLAPQPPQPAEPADGSA